MSSFLKSPGRDIFNSSKEENTIREIFYQHWKKMKEQMTITNDDINNWRHKCIAEINNYVDQYIQILKNDYDQQRNVFDESRRPNIDTAAA